MIVSAHPFQRSIHQESRATRAWPRAVGICQALDVFITGIVHAREMVLLCVRYDLAEAGSKGRVGGLGNQYRSKRHTHIDKPWCTCGKGDWVLVRRLRHSVTGRPGRGSLRVVRVCGVPFIALMGTVSQRWSWIHKRPTVLARPSDAIAMTYCGLSWVH